jgi:hypothetical protein
LAERAITGKRIILAVGIFLILAGTFVAFIRSTDALLLSVFRPILGQAPVTFWADKLHLVGYEIAIIGFSIIVAGLIILRRESFKKFAENGKNAAVVGIVLLILLWLPAVLFSHTATFNGERYWYLGDDAMISMRYAHNLAEGNGLVWNPGERVEGYSNFLWTLYMAVIHLLPIPISKTSIIILLTNLVLSAATIPVLINLVRRLGGDLTAIAATIIGFVLSANIMFWTTSGFETTLLTFLFLTAVYRIIAERDETKPRPFTYIIITVMAFVRADALIISLICYGLAFAVNKRKRLLAGYFGLTVLLFLSHELFRWTYYGNLLPNTAYLKIMNWDEKYAAGLGYVLGFMKAHLFLLVLLTAGIFAARQSVNKLLLALLAVYAVYVGFVGGDTFSNFRFFVPVLPLILGLAFACSAKLVANRRFRVAVIGLSIATMPLIVPGYAAHVAPREADVGNIEIGLYIKEATAEDAKIADFWAGSVFYFSERYAIDLLGKSDPHIAQLQATSNGRRPGHNKFDFDYSLSQLRPDYIVANFKLPIDEEKMHQESSGNYAFTGLLFYNGLFREHYYENPLNIDTWRTIFAYNSTNIHNPEKH